MRTTKDIDYNISKAWIECPACDNHYPSFGNAPLCDVCGYDDFVEFRNDLFKTGVLSSGLLWPN